VELQSHHYEEVGLKMNSISDEILGKSKRNIINHIRFIL